MTTTPTVWKPQFQLNPLDNPEIGQFALAISDAGDGNFVAVYTNGGDFRAQVIGPEGEPRSGAFGADKASTATSPGDENFPGAVAARPGGGFITAYNATHFVGSAVAGNGVFFDAYDSAGQRVDGGAIQSLAAPVTSTVSIAVRTDGSFLVTFVRANDDDSSDLVGRRVDAAGNVGGEVTIFHSVDGTLGEAAALTGGNYVVAYQKSAGVGDHDIEFKIFGQTGDPPSGAFQASLATNDETDPQVAALTGGGFVVVWQDDNGPGFAEIKAAVFNADGQRVKDAATVNGGASDDQIAADVVGLKDGGYVVVWKDQADEVIRGQRFDASGEKLGDGFVAGNSAGEDNPAVALLADGRVIVGFEAEKSGSRRDIDGTIFDPREKTIDGDADDNVITSRIDGAAVRGLDGADKLLGQAAADTLDGGRGNDRLKGGLGKDLLTGGTDEDTFVFDFPVASKSEANLHKDKVLDFSHKDDTIELSADQFSLLGVGKLKKKAFGSGDGDAAKDKHLVYWNEKSGKLYYDADGKDQKGKGDIEIAKFNKDADLAANDFLVA